MNFFLYAFIWRFYRPSADIIHALIGLGQLWEICTLNNNVGRNFKTYPIQMLKKTIEQNFSFSFTLLLSFFVVLFSVFLVCSNSRMSLLHKIKKKSVFRNMWGEGKYHMEQNVLLFPPHQELPPLFSCSGVWKDWYCKCEYFHVVCALLEIFFRLVQSEEYETLP